MQPFDRSDDDTPLTLVGVEFSDQFRAQEFLTAATRLAANGDLRLRDAVFVAADGDGDFVGIVPQQEGQNPTLNDEQPGNNSLTVAPILVVLAHVLGLPHDRFWRLAGSPGSLTAIEAWPGGEAVVAFTNRT